MPWVYIYNLVSPPWAQSFTSIMADLWQNIKRVSSFDSRHLMELFHKEIIVLLLTKQRKLTSFKEFFILRHFFLNNQLIKLKNLSWQRSVFNKVHKQLGPYSIVFREGHHPFIVMDGVEGKKHLWTDSCTCKLIHVRASIHTYRKHIALFIRHIFIGNSWSWITIQTEKLPILLIYYL